MLANVPVSNMIQTFRVGIFAHDAAEWFTAFWAFNEAIAVVTAFVVCHRPISFWAIARARLAPCRVLCFEASQRWRSEQYMRPARPFVATSQPGKVQRLHTFSFGT